jgi:hypothetical protein
MQYMMLIYADEAIYKQMSEAELARSMAEYREFTQSIVKSGHFRAGDQLASIANATSVRQRSGKVTNTDGPFVETKEQLGGYYLVECKDLDEALAIAARIPTVRHGGGIEVRPVIAMTNK